MKRRSDIRVVVTGFGAVTPLGVDFAGTWRNLIAGGDAAGPVNVFDVSGCRCKIAAQATLPELPQVPPKRLSRLPRASRLALPAAIEAMRQAGLLDGDDRSTQPVLPVSVSTTGGGMALGEAFMRQVLIGRGAKDQFFRVARYPAQQQVIDLQQLLGFRGPITIIANACASGANALGHAHDLIRSGAERCVLTGGFEALTELIYVGFDCLQALSTDRCRPFDLERNGLMLGEAAAFLVLESEEHARSRGAEILGVLAGYGHATDLHHLTQPQPEGKTQVAVMREALAEAGLEADGIGYVNAHGTGTPLNDASECRAFREVFGEYPGLVRISSTKSAIGHTLGAAGSIEALIALQALRSGELPPQINLRQPEPSIAKSLTAPAERHDNLAATMSVNLGFGGSNAALVFTRHEKPAAAATASIGGVGTTNRIATDLPACPGCAVYGRGAVSPSGIGVDALMSAAGGAPERMESLGGREFPVRRVDLGAEPFKRWKLHPRTRRATSITYYMLEAAQQALDEAGQADRSRLGIVAAFGSGSLIASRRFFDGILKNGQRFASPNLFPETVFNSPTSHVAAVLGAAGPAYSVVGDDSAWANAVAVAACWLRCRTVDAALVVGAEELDPIILDAYATARWFRDGSGFVAGEGAGAVLLRRHGSGDGPTTDGMQVRAGDDAPRGLVRITRVVEGFTHRRATQTVDAKWECLADVRDFPLWSPPANGVESSFAFAASAAWETLLAIETARRKRTRLALPIWGRNEQCSALILESC